MSDYKPVESIQILMKFEPFRAIIVDDEKEARDILENLLLDEGSVEVVGKISNAAEALKEIINLDPDVVFLDVNMPRINGFDLIKEIRELKLNPQIIFVTGYDHFVMDAIKMQAFDYLLKPIDQDELASTIQRLKLRKKPEEVDEKLNALIRKLDGGRVRFNTRQGFIVRPTAIILSSTFLVILPKR